MSFTLSFLFSLSWIVWMSFSCTSAFALDQIIRPYQSVRSAGMGGVRITTGLYDENFFNNPARVTANPKSKFTLLQLTPGEVTPPTINAASSIASGKDAITTVNSVAGQNLHDRIQLILPAFYRAASDDRKWAWAFGLITSLQTDADIRMSTQASFDGIVDIGPALTIGRKLLKNNALSIGLTGHLTYRLGTNPNYGLLDYIRGVPLTLNSLGGEGAMVDFDLGSTYKLTRLGEFEISIGGAIQNLLGGQYSNLHFTPLNIGSLPPAQPRSFGLGGSATRAKWGPFSETVFALEATDFLNNSNGSLFRLLHIGGETRWKAIAFRAGLNQGYWTAGLGLDAHYFTLNLASYGEEMGLNAGVLQDRRYTLDFGLHI